MDTTAHKSLIMGSRVHILSLALLGANCMLADCSNMPTQRTGKAMSLFNIIRFANSACPGSGNRNGTCYTEAECTAKKGVPAGSCASGYGVCCTFSATCGQTSNENCTYFDSSRVDTGACRLRICKCNDNICQLRLDFNSFIIAGPSTSTEIIGAATNGMLSAGNDVSAATQCMVDRFSVTNPGSSSPPTICGINTGEHMYVDANDVCNELAFQLGSSSSVNRQWSIKITQYSCDYDNLAPEGCTQYFFDNNDGVVKSFNFDGGVHLANQEQKICIRQERGNCQTCYFPVTDMDFIVSGKTGDDSGYITLSKCCGYGDDGAATTGYDCVIIPGALKSGQTREFAGNSQICGRKLITTTTAQDKNKTVCTQQRPFHITFRSDNFEFMMESMMEINGGFRLAYTQTSC